MYSCGIPVFTYVRHEMDSSEEIGVSALIYDFLLKKDASLAKVFQKKTHAVSKDVGYDATAIYAARQNACLTDFHAVPTSAIPRGRNS